MTLNDERALSPRAQRGRPSAWAPSSVREVLHRSAYRGETVWSRTRKRDTWGRKHQTGRPSTDWITVAAPQQRIVTDEEWSAAHARMDAARQVYQKAASRRKGGRPPLGSASPYLLTNLALCGACGGPLSVRTRPHGTTRKHFYGCANYHERGRALCGNRSDVPMEDADGIIIEALLDDVLSPDLLRDAVDIALGMLEGHQHGDRLAEVDRSLRIADEERARLAAAIATGGELESLLVALKAREDQRQRLEAERARLTFQRDTSASQKRRIGKELTQLAGSWRRVLVEDAANARPIVLALLRGRVSFTPTAERKRWHVEGEGTLSGLFSGQVFRSEWRP